MNSLAKEDLTALLASLPKRRTRRRQGSNISSGPCEFCASLTCMAAFRKLVAAIECRVVPPLALDHLPDKAAGHLEEPADFGVMALQGRTTVGVCLVS